MIILYYIIKLIKTQLIEYQWLAKLRAAQQ